MNAPTFGSYHPWFDSFLNRYLPFLSKFSSLVEMNLWFAAPSLFLPDSELPFMKSTRMWSRVTFGSISRRRWPKLGQTTAILRIHGLRSLKFLHFLIALGHISSGLIPLLASSRSGKFSVYWNHEGSQALHLRRCADLYFQLATNLVCHFWFLATACRFLLRHLRTVSLSKCSYNSDEQPHFHMRAEKICS